MKASANLLTKWSITGLTFVFLIDVVGIARATAQQNTGATPSGGSFVAPPDSGANPAANELPKPQSGHDALMKSRQALANGDIATAKSLVDSARHLPSETHLTGDTPAKVEAMIARHGELANMARFGDQHRYNNEAALFLLEQAEALIDYRDFTTAETLVLLAKQFPVNFKPGDRNPDQVLDRLQQARGTSSVDPQNMSAAKIEAFKLLSQAQLAFDQNNFVLAQQYVTRAKEMNIADSAYDGEAIKPWELELKIRKAMNNNVAQATYESPELDSSVKQADYYPELDQTQNVLASNETPATDSTDLDATQNPVDESRFQLPDMRGQQLYESGMSALANNDNKLALEYFRMAYKYRSQLDAQAQQVLQEKLGQLQATPASYRQQEEVQGVDEDLRQKMFTDVLRQRAVAEEMVKQRNPRGAMNHLRMLKDQVSQSALDPAGKQQLTAVVEREISELEDFIQRNMSEIENDEMNAHRLQEVEMDRQRRDDKERQVQKLVDEFNKLTYEERWAEAEMIARQAEAIAPEMEAVAVMVQKAKFRSRIERDRDVQERKENAMINHLIDLDEDTIPNDFDQPIEFDQNRWDVIAQSQNRSIATGFETIREREIWAKIRNESIQADFSNTPLSEAIDTLALKAGVNMIFDSRAMQMENVAIDQPVTMSIPNAISVESALNIILGNNNLVFTVEDEVIKITNQDALQKDPKRRVYYVGDLIMPVPDYGDPVIMKSMSPWNNGSQQYQGNNMWNGNNTNLGGDPSMNGVTPVSMMQQMPNMPGNPMNGFGGMLDGSGTTRSSSPQYNQLGPDGVGGGITEADFQELMDLIQETIDPDSWEDAGGSGRMQAFPATLSLIVTQTQENQDRIQDLLQRLRELNDVQIVVEVRFITLRDDFFERIGVDFDFRINDFSGFNPANVAIQDEFNPSGVIGRDAIAEVFLPTGDLDIPFTQNSFGSAIPQFGNFDAATAFNTGFAILSDIEVFFLLQAAKGDERSNIVQAPTVTMFNGQSASVFDGSLRPFVTSITPVVGDFAAAQQPVITILPEGTQLNVRATVSGDRRFVKMTLVPFFSQITAVDEFRFEGSRTVRSSDSNNLNDIIDAIRGNDNDLGDNDFEITEEGTTVQLPVFANTTITTTVSVPDGGTVLLGGIKRMSEGRIERGVPFLSNVPYVSRLFKNVGIGRETSSLMMMVTPRIIIQEEEEQFQVGTAPGN